MPLSCVRVDFADDVVMLAEYRLGRIELVGLIQRPHINGDGRRGCKGFIRSDALLDYTLPEGIRALRAAALKHQAHSAHCHGVTAAERSIDTIVVDSGKREYSRAASKSCGRGAVAAQIGRRAEFERCKTHPFRPLNARFR